MKKYRVQYEDRFVFIYCVDEYTTDFGEEVYIELNANHLAHLTKSLDSEKITSKGGTYELRSNYKGTSPSNS